MELLQIGELQGLGQTHVHAPLGGVQVGVGADGGDTPLRQGQQGPAGGGLVGEALHRVEDHRVVGHDQVGSPLRLVRHRLCDVQGDQDLPDLPLPPAHQETGVVKVHLGLKGGPLVHLCKNVSYRCHPSHSFFMSSRPSRTCSSSCFRASPLPSRARDRPAMARSSLRMRPSR